MARPGGSPMACVVALTRPPRSRLEGHYRAPPTALGPPDPMSWIAEVAGLLGGTLYDLRMRLAGAPPWVVGHCHGDAEARARVDALRAAGCGAVWADTAAVKVRDPGPYSVLAFEDEALRVEPGGWIVPLRAVRLVVLVTLDVERQTELVERVTVSNVPRRGRVEMDVSRHNYTRQQQKGLYLLGDLEAPALRIVQSTLRTAGMPGVTSRDRFDRFAERVCAGASEARVDRRFVEAPRKRTGFSLASTAGQPHEAVHSNLAATDLAVRLLALGYHEGQMA